MLSPFCSRGSEFLAILSYAEKPLHHHHEMIANIWLRRSRILDFLHKKPVCPAEILPWSR